LQYEDQHPFNSSIGLDSPGRLRLNEPTDYSSPPFQQQTHMRRSVDNRQSDLIQRTHLQKSDQTQKHPTLRIRTNKRPRIQDTSSESEQSAMTSGEESDNGEPPAIPRKKRRINMSFLDSTLRDANLAAEIDQLERVDQERVGMFPPSNINPKKTLMALYSTTSTLEINPHQSALLQ